MIWHDEPYGCTLLHLRIRMKSTAPKLFSIVPSGQLRPQRPTGLPAFQCFICVIWILHEKLSLSITDLPVDAIPYKRLQVPKPCSHELQDRHLASERHTKQMLDQHHELSLATTRPIHQIIEHLPNHTRLPQESTTQPIHSPQRKPYLNPLITCAILELDTAYTLMLARSKLVLTAQLRRRTKCVVI